jgi:hypothetical protein
MIEAAIGFVLVLPKHYFIESRPRAEASSSSGASGIPERVANTSENTSFQAVLKEIIRYSLGRRTHSALPSLVSAR